MRSHLEFQVLPGLGDVSDGFVDAQLLLGPDEQVADVVRVLVQAQILDVLQVELAVVLVELLL